MLLYEDLTYQIRGACFEIWKHFGPAFKEAVYHEALKEEFKKRGIPFTSERRIDIIYTGKKVGVYKPDFIVDDKILIELKVVPKILRLHEKQVW